MFVLSQARPSPPRDRQAQRLSSFSIRSLTHTRHNERAVNTKPSPIGDWQQPGHSAIGIDELDNGIIPCPRRLHGHSAGPETTETQETGSYPTEKDQTRRRSVQTMEAAETRPGKVPRGPRRANLGLQQHCDAPGRLLALASVEGESKPPCVAQFGSVRPTY